MNTAHANGGVLIHAGESILLFCDNVEMDFSGQDAKEFKGLFYIRKIQNIDEVYVVRNIETTFREFFCYQYGM